MAQGYQLVPGDLHSLRSTELPSRAPGLRDLRIRIRAVALNYRDLMIARGETRLPAQPLIPCSDAAGEVVEVGASVTRFKPGDRVAPIFFPQWLDGAPTGDQLARALGGTTEGVLAKFCLAHEDAVVEIPKHLEFTEAATLPCAGVTAWNALASGAPLRGRSILVLGTGGVSMMALQFAKAAGAVCYVTSSSDAKLEKARAIGADHGVNYRTHPEWHREIRRLSEGHGVDLVVETTGQATLRRSIGATATGGVVAVVGALSGASAEIEPLALVSGARSLRGIAVGSRAMFEDLNKFLSTHRIAPVIDRMFEFGEAAAAYAYLASGRHFGKVVIVGSD